MPRIDWILADPEEPPPDCPVCGAAMDPGVFHDQPDGWTCPDCGTHTAAEDSDRVLIWPTMAQMQQIPNYALRAAGWHPADRAFIPHLPRDFNLHRARRLLTAQKTGNPSVSLSDRKL